MTYVDFLLSKFCSTEGCSGSHFTVVNYASSSQDLQWEEIMYQDNNSPKLLLENLVTGEKEIPTKKNYITTRFYHSHCPEIVFERPLVRARLHYLMLNFEV